MEQKELDKIIKLHEKWIAGDYDGKRADLNSTSLNGANLIGADLSMADLNGADLSNADLSNTNLNSADLSNADLLGANLSGANLSCANLNGANLNGANLNKAFLNLVNWHETMGIVVYVAGLQSSRRNAQLTYIPSLDIATTGCWQNTWEATKKRVEDTYKAYNPKIYKKYQLAFQYIEDQMLEEDK